MSFFYYFAYGSNLFGDRLKLNNKSAVKHENGKLRNYKLIFCGQSKSWHGAVASIEECPENEVWGVIWKLDVSDSDNLDRQEMRYNSLTVNVEIADGSILECKTYAAKSNGSAKPSVSYKSVILKGARDNYLPLHYITKLEVIEDNQNDDTPRIIGLAWPLR